MLVRWQIVMAVSFLSMAYVNRIVHTNNTIAKKSNMAPKMRYCLGTHGNSGPGHEQQQPSYEL